MAARLRVRIVAMGPRLRRVATEGGTRLAWQQWGSDLMRSRQLAALIRPHLPERVDLTVSTIPRAALPALGAWIATQPEAVFILLKNVARSISPQQLDRLRRRAVALGVDHIDGDVGAVDLAAYDVHIAASYAGLAALERACGRGAARTRLLLHHADPRLDGLSFPPLPRLAAAYVGYPPNLLLPEALAGEVAVLPVATSADMARALPRLPAFNLHFAVRAPDPAASGRLAFKPFTKGAVAAACRSNIVVARSEDDAVAFLGDDYPYLVEDARAESIVAAMARARDDFGGPRWLEGLDRMRRVRDLVSPPALARQFMEIVAAVT